MEWIAALEASAVGSWMRTSSWAYAVVNVAHVIGLVLLLGSMLMLDLRLLGAARGAISLQAASALLTPFAVIGVGVMLVSGFLLFAADAVPLLSNPLFLPKMVLVVLGVANALTFRQLWAGRALETKIMPPAARFQAALSLSVWVAAAILGRLLAYV